MTKQAKSLFFADGDPAHPGQAYKRILDPDSGVWGWRKWAHSLLYRDKGGQIHAHQPGEDKQRDLDFPLLAFQRGYTLVGRAERRELHRAERKRYKAIVKARGAAA